MKKMMLLGALLFAPPLWDMRRRADRISALVLLVFMHRPSMVLECIR